MKLRVICKCGYNGQVCDKVIPKLDEAGYVIVPESTKDGEWLVCSKCERNHSLGNCSGYFGFVTYPNVDFEDKDWEDK